MKKQTIINIISYILVLAIIIGILSKVSYVVEMKYSESNYGSFFDENEDYDVLFLGSSKVINGFFPMQLWKDYGITSYNWGAHANLLPATYWLFMNTLDYKEPKVVVIDMFQLASDYKYTSPEYLHNWIDVFDLSLNKIKAIVDLNSDSNKNKAIKDGKLDKSNSASVTEFFWDFCKYHSRWNDIYDESFKPPVLAEKGAQMRLNIFPQERRELSTTNTIPDEKVGVIYLRKIIEACKERSIEVVLVNLPDGEGEEGLEQAVKMKELANEYDIKQIDFMEDNVIVDYEVDFYDGKHLNPLGGMKTTDFIGKYLLAECGINSHKGEDVEEYWQDDYRYYCQYKTELFDRTESLNNSLLLLKDNEFTSFFCINNLGILEDEVTKKVLDKLGVDRNEIERVFAENGVCYVILKDAEATNENQVEYLATLGNEYLEMIETKASDQGIQLDYSGYSMRVIVYNESAGMLAVNDF